MDGTNSKGLPSARWKPMASAVLRTSQRSSWLAMATYAVFTELAVACHTGCWTAARPSELPGFHVPT